uniref:Putative ovule protein n=1 Tax=Solanum chacoense TaxID=4108 RepID=A0A0V0GIY2_SOLCH
MLIIIILGLNIYTFACFLNLRLFSIKPTLYFRFALKAPNKPWSFFAFSALDNTGLLSFSSHQNAFI